MHVFIDFWKLETENSLLHVFNFLHKLNFENSFCFLPILSCQTSFLVLKIENCFWKQKIREKNSYQTYPKSLNSEPNHVASTWTRRERKTKGNTAGTYQPLGKKRVTRTEANLPAVLAKRFQDDPKNEKSPSVVVGAIVQPRQQKWVV